MNKNNNYLKKKTFIPSSLVYLSICLLGVLFVLAFYVVASNDTFYLYDDFITMRVNGTYKIDAEAEYDVSELDWYSQNPEVATIDSDGTISAHSLGETTIVVKSRLHLFEQMINIRVSNFNVYSIVFEEESVNINPGEELFLSPVLNGDGNLKSNLNWKSSDDAVVTVTSTGKVKGITAGKAIITATDKYTGLATSIDVNIKGDVEEVKNDTVNQDVEDEELEEYIPIESINLNTNHLSMYAGSTRKISAVITPNDATEQDLVYTSGDTSVATVDSSGMIKALKEGICNIFVSSSDNTVSVSMLVEIKGQKVTVTDLTLEKESLELDINESYMIMPIISPENASEKGVTYASSDPSVATVDDNGKIKALKKGHTTIVVISKDTGKTVSLVVDVSDKEIKTNKIASISINNFKDTLLVGENNKVNVEILNSKKENVNVNFSTSNPDIATVDQEGNIKALTTGIVTLELETTDGSYHENKIITVLPGDIEPELIYINKSVLQLVKGSTTDLVATVIPEIATNKKIVWSSSNTNVATVESGKIKAIGAGTATITAQVRNTGISKSVRVAVVNKQQIIDVRKQRLTPYYTNFKIYEEGKKTSRSMQNFAIANIGTNKEIIYTSFTRQSNIKKGASATTAKKNAIMQTIVVKIPKDAINSPNSKKRTYMYLNKSGHGQSLDLDKNTNYIWTNGDGYTYKNSIGVYWASNRQLVKVAFKKNNANSTFKANKKITLYNEANVIYDKTELTFNWDEDLAVVRSGRIVLIYKASDFVNGRFTLLYTFTLASKSSNGTNYSRQGHAAANGYYYQYRGYLGTKLYIEAYNYVGELQYTYIFSPKLSRQETEGLKIYNNRIYIGVTHACSNCSGRVNDIYYFK